MTSTARVASKGRTSRRPYDSPLRRQRAAETCARIVQAGVEILHGTPSWSWHLVTVRAVAERAGVNERTVYRHFANERALRDAVLARMEQEAGVDIESLTLDDLGPVTDRIFAYVASVPVRSRTTYDATAVGAVLRQRKALRAVMAEARPDWSDVERRVAAAVVEALWNVGVFEQMVLGGELEPSQAAAGLRWVIELVEEAVCSGRRPEVG